MSSLETSGFTSIQAHVREWAAEQQPAVSPLESTETPELLPLRDSMGTSHGIPFNLQDYLELVDWTGRAVHPDKRGAISSRNSPILARLGIDPHRFIFHMNPRPYPGFHRVIGKLARIKHAAERIGVQFFKGQGYAAKLFGVA